MVLINNKFYLETVMKKIFLFLMLFFVIGCVKKENCQDARKGFIVVLEKPFLSYNNNKVNALFFQASTIDDIRNDSPRVPYFFVINKLPKGYAKRDTISVHISFKYEPSDRVYRPPTIEITCIERIH